MINTDTVNKYLEDNNLPANEGYLLKDAGEGAFIAKWEISAPKPTAKTLLAYLPDIEAEKELQIVLSNRRSEYPPVEDQLDEIMKWLATENEFSVPDKLKSIAMRCMSVKSRYPKPEVRND